MLRARQPTDVPMLQSMHAIDADEWHPAVDVTAAPEGDDVGRAIDDYFAKQMGIDTAATMESEVTQDDGEVVKKNRLKPRKTIDHHSEFALWRERRRFQTSADAHKVMRPPESSAIELLPPAAYKATGAASSVGLPMDKTVTSVVSRYVHTSTNKIRCPVNIVKWTPEARRVITGSTSGEFTLWNGVTFNFETIMQAHDQAIRAMEWSHSGNWLVSADNGGTVKYFQPNMNNLQIFDAHEEPIRDVSFSPNDERFLTASDDGTMKIWNFASQACERTLKGHGWDVRCARWHPTKGLIVSGSKDNLVKFWDPRTEQVLATLHGHKNTIQTVSWSPSGNLVASGSRDQFIKVFDIRAMRELVTLRGHKKDVSSLAWHPVHESILASGGSDGSILHWNMPDADPLENVEYAHESAVWSLAFHPMGHLLVSGSNDHATKFWSRSRPGLNLTTDKYHIGREKALEIGDHDEDEDDEEDEDQQQGFIPGIDANRARQNYDAYRNNDGQRQRPGFFQRDQPRGPGGYQAGAGGWRNAAPPEGDAAGQNNAQRSGYPRRGAPYQRPQGQGVNRYGGYDRGRGRGRY